MPRLQGLIFDLDGTLLDSAPDLRQALNMMLKDHGRRALTLDEVKSMTGDGMLPMMERAFAATGAPLPASESYARFQGFITHYRILKPDPAQIYPHAGEMLERYHAAGVKLGICTNKQEEATMRLLKDLDLARHFTFIAGGDTFPVHKPNPGHVLGVMEKLQVATEDCVMIGDGSNDVRAAQGAGIPCILVTHGYGVDVEELGADSMIGSLRELPEALAKLGFV
jgi:phosphoglycolate phosphatase